MLDGCDVVEDLGDILMEVDSGEPELCCVDMITRIDEGEYEVLSCEECIYKGTEAYILMCPYVWISKIMRKVIC